MSLRTEMVRLHTAPIAISDSRLALHHRTQSPSRIPLSSTAETTNLSGHDTNTLQKLDPVFPRLHARLRQDFGLPQATFINGTKSFKSPSQPPCKAGRTHCHCSRGIRREIPGSMADWLLAQCMRVANYRIHRSLEFGACSLRRPIIPTNVGPQFLLHAQNPSASVCFPLILHPAATTVASIDTGKVVKTGSFACVTSSLHTPPQSMQIQIRFSRSGAEHDANGTRNENRTLERIVNVKLEAIRMQDLLQNCSSERWCKIQTPRMPALCSNATFPQGPRVECQAANLNPISTHGHVRITSPDLPPCRMAMLQHAVSVKSC